MARFFRALGVLSITVRKGVVVRKKLEELERAAERMPVILRNSAGSLILSLLGVVRELVVEVEKLKNPAQPGKGDGDGA